MKTVNFSKLKKHLVSLDKEGKLRFAANCGTSLGYLRKRMCLGKPFGYDISRRIADLGVMTPEELMPDDHFKYVW